MNQRVLRDCKLDTVSESLLLRLKFNDVIHHNVLEEVHVPLLVLSKLLDETLERFSCLSLRGL